MPFRRHRQGGDICAVYVHAGAGFHSYVNEKLHLAACQDAANVAFTLLKNGGTAVDAVEMTIKVLEDREITNCGYGSNMCMDGMVECDASIVDHHGRSGAAGAVAKVKNPIGLARMILNESTRPLSLDRVPPNLLVGPGAAAYAEEKGLLTVFNDYMVSKGSKERWVRWKRDLDQAEEDSQLDRERQAVRESTLHSSRTTTPDSMPIDSQSDMSPPLSSPSNLSASALSSIASSHRPMVASTADVVDAHSNSRMERLGKYNGVLVSASTHHSAVPETDYSIAIESDRPAESSDIATDDDHPCVSKCPRLAGSHDGTFDDPESASFRKPPNFPIKASGAHPPPNDRQDRIIDTVGAIAVDCYGNIAAGSSSGGIGMKRRGRCGPAALNGVGTAVIPVDPEDPDETCVATVTSGTGEHMATTLAAATCADRIYSSVRKVRGSELESCSEDQAMYSMIAREFMGHPGVQNSHCTGAIGIMAVKKTRHGIMLLFGHNTDSFALANMQSFDRTPSSVMSRTSGYKSIAQGGRFARYWRKGSRA